MSKTLRTSIWNPIRKKTQSKSISIKKVGSEEKAREFLDNWKKEMKEEFKKAKENKAEDTEIEEDTDNIIVEDKNVDLDVELDDKIDINIHWTPFFLDVTPLKTGSTLVIFGASKSYKTTQLKQILNKYYNDDKKIMKILMAENIHAEIYDDLLKDVIRIDGWRSKLIKIVHRVNKKTANKYPTLFILDDIITEKNDKNILKMFLTLRNAKISTIMLLQSTTLLHPNSRFNSNFFIFKRWNNQQAIKKVLENFLNGYDPFFGKRLDDQIRIYKKITKDGFIMLDNINDIITFHKNIR